MLQTVSVGVADRVSVDIVDRLCAFRVFHRRINPHVLSQDSSQHASPSRPQLDRVRAPVSSQLRRTRTRTPPPSQQQDHPCSPRGRQTAHLDTGQAEDTATRGVLLDRVYL